MLDLPYECPILPLIRSCRLPGKAPRAVLRAELQARRLPAFCFKHVRLVLSTSSGPPRPGLIPRSKAYLPSLLAAHQFPAGRAGMKDESEDLRSTKIETLRRLGSRSHPPIPATRIHFPRLMHAMKCGGMRHARRRNPAGNITGSERSWR
jgi:hypothetical protein